MKCEALSGVRILDIATVIAAPWGAGLLADFGAEVIKVEMPGRGDSFRAMGPLKDGVSIRWPSMGRNKKSITLDFHYEQGKELFLKLVAKSDVIFENFRTGTLSSVYTRSGQNSTPNSNATNLHSSQKRCCSFCISSSNASPTFQVQKSIFHQMTKPIQVTVILPLLLAISFSRNDDIHSSISGISNDLIGVIPTIGQ